MKTENTITNKSNKEKQNWNLMWFIKTQSSSKKHFFSPLSEWFDYQVIWHYHLIISDSAMWKRLQNVYSKIKQTRPKPLSQTIWQPPPLNPVSYQPSTHRRLLALPVCVIASSSSGEDSFVITSRQFGIHSFLQSDFQRLVHSVFLESIILFSSWSKDSLYAERIYDACITHTLLPENMYWYTSYTLFTSE